MKVAILGNMNNNNFALMRYLRDLNVDAKLFLFENDGILENSQFTCESDTYEIEKWEPYIYKTKIINSHFQVLGVNQLTNFLLHIFYSLVKLCNVEKHNKFKPSIFGIRKYLNKTFQDYDYIISNGNAPALFYRAGIKLNFFAGYSFGIEYLNCSNTEYLLNSKNFIIRYYARKIKEYQYCGLKNVVIRNTQFGITKKTLDKFNLDYVKIDYPMVYLSKNHLTVGERNNVKLFEKISQYDFKILSHSRHLWVQPSKVNFDNWEEKANKHNNWLIESFNDFVLQKKDINPLLILFEYGDNVKESKELIKNLKLEENILWLSKMKRKDILSLIDNVDVVASEFYSGEGIMWGGTGWETLAVGKPLIVGFNFPDNSFEENFGFSPPPIFEVSESKDIFKHLKFLAENLEFRLNNGKKNKEWFAKHNAYHLTERWISEIKNSL